MIMRFAAVILFLVGLTCLSQAQIPMTGAGKGAPGGSAGYTGPADIVASPLFYWGTRCVNTAYTGNVIGLSDSATGNTTGTLLVAASGCVITASASGSACTWITGNACSPLATTCATACNIFIIYDQSGNTTACGGNPCPLQANSNANRPTYVQSFAGGHPCMLFSHSANSDLQGGSPGTTAQPYSISTFFKSTTSSTTNGLFGSNLSAGISIVSTTALQAFSPTGGAGAEATITTATNIAGQFVFNGASSHINVSGTSTSTNPGTGSFGGGQLDIGQDGFGDSYDSDICELVVWGSNITASEAALVSNQLAWW